MLVLKGLVGLHTTIQLQLLQCYWFGQSALKFLGMESSYLQVVIMQGIMHPRKHHDSFKAFLFVLGFTRTDLKLPYSIWQIAEGNGTPLQYSCLENPMDGGAWKAAVHGVAEGRT